MGSMKKLSDGEQMKILVYFFIFINSLSVLIAGAPPLNKDPIPQPPHLLSKTNHLIIGVEWNKESLKDLLPASLKQKPKLTGGITIFNSRKKQDFYPLSGAYGWIDAGNRTKIVVFSIFGPNKTLNNVMKMVYNFKSKPGSNKVTFMNKKSVATASINKKNVIILSATDTEDCVKAEGMEMLKPLKPSEGVIFQEVKWSTNEKCAMIPKEVILKGELERFKVSKLLWANIYKNADLNLNLKKSN